MSRSSTITDDSDGEELPNPHPGVILKDEFLDEIGLSQNQLAQAIGVPGNRIHAIVNGTRSITADTDVRLCRFFALSEGYFLRLQNAFDTMEAKRRLGEQIVNIKPYGGTQAADSAPSHRRSSTRHT
jgi:addiction module HigA family antidote